MGRLTHDTTIHHFSHPHPLHLSSSTQRQHSLIPLSCAACTLPPSSSWTYSCHPCNFHLHIPCSQLPPLIHHPSHPAHPLALLPTPAYPEAGYFDCDACGCTGTGFSYHCRACSVDLHTACASMPLSVGHYAHAQHLLTMAFCPPYDKLGFSCDVCGGLGGNHWLYRCALCEFDVHLGCGDRAGPPGPVVGSVSQHGVNRMGSGSGKLIRQMVGSILDGAGQQIGQSLVQDFMGGSGGDGNDGNDGGGGDGGGSSILNVGCAILGSVLEGALSEDN